MLLWPVGVVPGPVRYDFSHIDPPTKVTIKSYQWESKRQVGYDEEQLPHYDGTPETVKFTWSTPATTEDLALVTNGVAKSTPFVGRWTLPDTLDEKTGCVINRFLHQRGAHPAKIIHQCLKSTTSIYGTALLRTCTRLRDVGSQVLYSNRIVFDTRGQAPFTHPLGVHSYHALRSNRHLIPGLPYENGDSPSYAKNKYVTGHMFTGNLEGHEFLRRDPITGFFHQAGAFNAANLRNIKIEGFLKTVQNGQNPRDCPVGLLDLLPIYTAIFKHCCHKLESLTIVLVPGAESLNVSVVNDANKKTEEQRIDEAIAQVVHGIQWLKVLELKAPVQKCLGKKKSSSKAQDPAYPWGTALRWEKFVADRAKRQAEVAAAAAKKKKAREEAEKKVDDTVKKAEEDYKMKVEAWKAGKDVVYEVKAYDKLPAVSKKNDVVDEPTIEVKEEKALESEKPVATPTFRKGKKGKPGSRAAKANTEASPISK